MKPFSRLKNVVLPAPFGPMMPRISPLHDLDADIAHRLESAECFRDVAHLEHDRAVAAFLRSRQFRDDPDAAAPGCGGWTGGSAARRRSSRSLTFQNTPSGASRITATIAMPYTTPWMPGMTLPSCACRNSLSGTSTTAPITGPHSVPTPPNMATISACADTSMPNTAGGVTTSSTTA